LADSAFHWTKTFHPGRTTGVGATAFGLSSLLR
jgi:hypothetical protein